VRVAILIADPRRIKGKNMTEVFGWHVWAETEGGTRKFTVACAEEAIALEIVRHITKGIRPVFREPATSDVMEDLSLDEGKFIEWVPVGRGRKIIPGGISMKKRSAL
jgi:hypothetical protein